ncbi:MAG: DCC1-like thiol-disulfide oxidoreductase family protein [Micavibrio sp.]|nr:DCC1-like thiol-disulfide oxidoreductase family protein [Micavibrio sp.]
MTAAPEKMWIVYDGECPFCTRYVRWVRLKKNLDVTLVNAREDSTLRKELTEAGYDLDNGMAVKYAGKIYYADEAMTLLSLMSTPSGIVNGLMAWTFGSRRRAKILYPAFATVRLMTVCLLGRGKINNLPR